MLEVLTPESPRWEQFIARLDSIGLIGGGCDGDAGPRVHRHAKAVMAEMGDIDIEKTSLFSRAEAAIATVKSCSTLRGGRTPPVRYLLHFCPVNEKRPRSLNPEAFEHRHR